MENYMLVIYGLLYSENSSRYITLFEFGEKELIESFLMYTIQFLMFIQLLVSLEHLWEFISVCVDSMLKILLYQRFLKV